MDAEAFWQANVEALAEREKQEVLLHLPSISDSDVNSPETPHQAEQDKVDPVPVGETHGSTQKQAQSPGTSGGPEAAEPSPT